MPDMSTDPSPSAIREQLGRLERSAHFAASGKLMAFLRFIVEETLAGRSALLKESVVGIAVYGRQPAYDPRIDSTVRVEARRLRRKLADYYAEGHDKGGVRIDLPTGGYIPLFSGLDADDAAARSHADGPIFHAGPGAAVAILPFRALSADPADHTFAEGLTDEMMYALGQAPGVRITSRATAFQLRDSTQPLTQLAADLGVDTLMQGTVRREGDVMRITAEMSDPNGFVMWADRFDADCRDRIGLQERIAATMLSRLRLDSSRMRAMQISPGPTALAAFAKIYRGRQLLDQQTPSAIREAMNLFKEICGTAPDYARGHSGIADCTCDLFRLGLIDHDAALTSARTAANRALEIDPHSIEAHAAQATVAAWLEWDATKAEAGFQRALLLGENARAARLYGVLLTIQIRHEEAEQLFDDARAIEPLSVQQSIAEALTNYQSRRFSALTALPQAKQRTRTPVEVLVYTALAHVFGGDPAVAFAMVPEIERAAARTPSLMLVGAEIEAWCGHPQRAVSLLETNGGKGTWFARAMLAASAGVDALSLASLKQALDQRELSAIWLPNDARLDRLRDSEDFPRLLAQLRAMSAHDD